MATGTGYLAKCVIVPEATYGTLAASGQQSIHLASESLTQTFDPLSNALKSQDAAEAHPNHGNENVGGSTTFELDYDNGILELLTVAMGTKDISPTNFSFADPNEQSVSLIIDKTVNRHQFTGGQVQRITLSSSAETTKLMAEVEWIFQGHTRSATAILADTWTASTWIKHCDLTFLIGDIADALAAADELKITDFSLSIFNNFITGDRASGDCQVIQAIRAGYRECELTFTASRYNSDAEIAAIDSAATGDTQLQASFSWDGPGNDELTILIPEIFITETPGVNVTGPAPLTYTAKGRCYKNLNNLTHMSTVAKELEIGHIT